MISARRICEFSVRRARETGRRGAGLGATFDIVCHNLEPLASHLYNAETAQCAGVWLGLGFTRAIPSSEVITPALQRQTDFAMGSLDTPASQMLRIQRA